ncbi:MAG: TonB-dependent receptor plug domain-containing protein, partial [Hyphomonadaceae bacterium]
MTKKSGIRSRAKAAVAQAAFGVSLLALGAHGAFAQEAQYAEAGEVSGVTVTATPNVADSPRYTAPVLDLPQTITVVEREIIDQQNLLGLRDVLSTLPGITFGAGEGGGGYGDSINLRGYSASNDITVDGVRDSAQYTRSDPFNLDQIEVTNGANSVYGGAGSIGGSINLVTRRPVDSTYAIVTGAIGTDEYARGTLDWNQELSDTAAFRLNAMV